jgi:DNA-binding NtrC family response regulator
MAGRRERMDEEELEADREGSADTDGAVAASNGKGGSFKDQVAALERQLIKEALDRAGGNRSKAAEELGIYRRLLYAKIKEYGLGE